LDSFKEEFYSPVRYMFDAGYDVILFEGPGQGAVQRKSNLYMTYEWEKPTSAVLDHFKLSDVTLIGVSMGGFLAPRAAAFDQRISRVVAYDVTPYDLRGSGAQAKIYQFLIKNPAVYNWIANTSMKMSAQADQLISQWMYITGACTPAEWNEQLQYYSIADVAPQIQQDILLLAGEEDHLIPIQEYHNNMKGYPNAKSVTGRIFTKEEHAQNHCQVGNIKLALDVILNWVEEKP
jgi:pimeloyl-ACP methyl ester carboxylesterase